MRNRFMIATLSTTLVLSGCASTDNKEKKDEKVVHKKKETMEVKQDAVSLPEEAETKHVLEVQFVNNMKGSLDMLLIFILIVIVWFTIVQK